MKAFLAWLRWLFAPRDSTDHGPDPTSEADDNLDAR